jgi:hypothetical protein
MPRLDLKLSHTYQYVAIHRAPLIRSVFRAWTNAPDVGRSIRVGALPIALAGPAARRYRRVLAGRLQKGLPMSKLALALLISAALAVPALAQPKEEPKTEAAKKVAIPTNTFFKGQTASQYLAGEQLIGVKVLNKDGQTIGTISDLIVGTGDKIEGVILGVGGFLGVGEKKLGVRLGALRISKADGKINITFPAATKEMLGAVDAYQRPGGAASAKK